MSTLWTSVEIEELKTFVKAGKSKEFLMKYFNRTGNAIEVKVNRLGLKLDRPHKRWTKKELENFSKDWGSPKLSMQGLVRKYHRSHHSLRKKALQLNLGARPYDDEYLDVATIVEEMNISSDRVYHFIELGLPHKINKSGKTKYLILQDDLLAFLESHQDLYNASDISDYLFYSEPNWLREKRIKDSKAHNKNTLLRSEYTNEEDKTLEFLFKSGFSISDIALRFNRTETAIKTRLKILGYTSKFWNDYEVEILKSNSRYMTLDELVKLLPLRTVKGIQWKCEQLGIPYHMVKSKCEKRDK